MRDHRKLRAFHLADEMAIATYQLTKSFPKEETFGLVAQMRRSAVSIASNIVEGCSRDSQNDFVRFIEIAYGSAKELRYQFSLAFRLEYIDEKEARISDAKLLETEKVLGGLIRAVRKSRQSST
jgi:four helix bundle protein